MDDAKQPANGVQLPLHGPHSARPPNREASPPAVTPLRLLLQPSGPVLELTQPDMLVGRHSEADLRLPLPDVSRRHCRFLFTDGAWQVLDLDSLNGVFVNGERVQHVTLRDHDTLTIGGFQFEVDLSGRTSAASNSENAEAIIHRITDALLRTAPDVDSQHKAY